MSKSYVLLLPILLLGHSICAQSFSEWIDQLENLPIDDRQPLVDSLIQHTDVFPITEQDTLAHFVYQGTPSSVSVAGDFTGWNPNASLVNINGTDLWYHTEIFPANARLDYKLVANSNNWMLDPLNPNTVPSGFGPNSELAMPAYVQPWEIEPQANIPKGSLQTILFESSIMEKSYQVQVYLPPSYATATNRSYPVAYFHDGQEYLGIASGKNIIDNLIQQGSLSEMIGIFIKPNDRIQEYGGSERQKYRQFVAEELVPYVDEQYRSIPEAESRATIGTSFGGNISGLILYHHGDRFAKAGLHSPAFWPNDYEVSDLLQQGLDPTVQIASVWGTFEPLDANVQLVMNNLADSGLVTYTNRLPEGHSWGLWRATLDELLIFLFPPNSTSTRNENGSKNSLQVSPNPCAQPCTLFLSHAAEQDTNWTLISLDEQTAGAGRLPGGEKEISLPKNLPGGIYILKLGNKGLSVKVVLE